VLLRDGDVFGRVVNLAAQAVKEPVEAAPLKGFDAAARLLRVRPV
jgi:hypothetical protein